MHSILIVLLCIVCVFILILYILAKKKVNYNYWKNKNVPHLKPTLLIGNYGEYLLMKKYMGHVVQEICQKFPKEPYVGAYYGTEPTLILQDPELIKLIIAKDFPYFNGREASSHADKEIGGRSLFFTYGDRWKVMRQHMSPLFTSSKIKNMFPLIEKCAHVFEELLDRETGMSNVVGIQALMGRYTMDCICSCGFGIDTNTMAEDVASNPFAKIGELIFENSYIRGYLTVARAVWPGIFYMLRLNMFPRAVSNFFTELLTGVFQTRQYKSSTRNDFVDMILSLKKSKDITSERFFASGNSDSRTITMKVDDDFLVAQCMLFFAAGYETSATTLHYTLYELAKNEEAQRRAIEEIDEYLFRHEGKIGYNCVNELQFLDACVDEALRLYPVLGVLTREVMEDYMFPDGLRLQKGVRIHLPVYHLHHHPDYFAEPELFKPERFLPEAKRTIMPYTYMPFGEGPRICIGMRIAKMQMLPGLVAVLKKYRVSLARGTSRSLTFDPRSLPTRPTDEIHLRLEIRDDWQKRVFAKSV